MIVRHLDKAKFHRAYSNFVQPLLPIDDMKPPFRSALETIPPNGFSRSHLAQQAETLFIIKGNGTIIANGKIHKVSQYDVVSIPAFTRKLLTNTDKEKDLVFLSVCWIERKKQSEIDHYVLLIPPQKTNATLQLGHTAWPNLAADIFKRFLQLNGKDVSPIIGDSDFLRDLPENAMLSEGNQNFRSKYVSSNSENTLHDDSQADYCMKETKILDHQKNTRKLVQTMYDRGLFVTKKEDVQEEKERLFFPLSDYKNELKDYYKKIDINESLKDYCEAILQEDLPDVPVSFYDDGEISMPITKYENQKISESFEMLELHISSISKVENEKEIPSSKTKKVQFLDHDQYFLYVVLLPAMYMALYPKKKFVDGYVTNAEDRKPLTNNSPAIKNAIASKWEFEEFARIFKQMVIDYLNEIKMEFQLVGNNISIELHSFSKEEKRILQHIQIATAMTHDYYQIKTFSPKDSLKTIYKLLKSVKRYNQLKSPIENKLAINFLVIRHISCLLHPITPGLSEKIDQMLFQTSKSTWLDQVKILRDYFIDPTITFE